MNGNSGTVLAVNSVLGPHVCYLNIAFNITIFEADLLKFKFLLRLIT